MHHLILVRTVDADRYGSIGCCCRVGVDDVRWSGSRADLPVDEATARFGELYLALRRVFGRRLDITVLDPRNVVSFVPLVARDAIRYRVPLRDAVRSLGAMSCATGVLDGRLLYSGTAPSTPEVLDRIAARLDAPPARAGA